ILRQILGLALFAFVLAGCDTASQEVEPVVSPDDKPVATFVADKTAAEFSEGDTITYTVTIDKWLDRSLTVSAHVVGGTADDDDFTYVPAVIQPYTNEAQLQIIINRDYANDPDEEATLEIGAFSMADKYLVNPSVEWPEQTFTIKNYVSDVLEISFSWDKDVIWNPNYDDYPDHTNTAHTGSEIDFDFLVGDEASGAPLDYAAATGDEPEQAVLYDGWMEGFFLTEGLTDGKYFFVAEMYTNSFIEDSDYEGATITHTSVPVTTTFTQQGVFSATVTQPEELWVMTSDSAQNVPLNFVGAVEMKDGTFTIIDYENSVLYEGKAAVLKTNTMALPGEAKK
ncbi:MAG TPA: hypothetical protein VJ951_12205, partial [Bacteroidales bacterium]|nr:hypothetical protein [Bacteroidales bacterium]